MKKYTVVNRPLFLKGGVLGLTGEQYESRKHALKALGHGRYEVIAEVCFKIGEKIGYGGQVPKITQTQLEEVEKRQTDEKSAKKKTAINERAGLLHKTF